ncbi:MAG: dephospho-CoA kinase [Chloroflexi bacterium]|nr:dephospho-CoA kinase [Chloroflexota bacterium]
MGVAGEARVSAFVLGLTGPIGAGKSTVASLLRAKGAVVLDADGLVRAEQLPGTPGHAAIVAAFGPGIVGEDRAIDRAKLAAIAFADPAALARLEAILHPLVRARVQAAHAALGDNTVLVVEAIKLLESPLKLLCGTVWVVTASRAVLLERLARERGMAAGEAVARLAAQADDAMFRAQADLVIENDGDRAALARAVDRAWAALASSSPIR